MRIQRRFVWSDERADEYEEILSPSVARLVTHSGKPFYLRHWDIRYAAGAPRVTDAVYDEWIHDGKARTTPTPFIRPRLG